jgi:hypothetical protein
LNDTTRSAELFSISNIRNIAISIYITKADKNVVIVMVTTLSENAQTKYRYFTRIMQPTIRENIYFD